MDQDQPDFKIFIRFFAMALAFYSYALSKYNTEYNIFGLIGPHLSSKIYTFSLEL